MKYNIIVKTLHIQSQISRVHCSINNELIS